MPQLWNPKELRNFDNILFDCDGVLWIRGALIDGAKRTVETLRALGKRLFFVTNNSTKSRDQYAKKFANLGIAVNREEIFPVSYSSVAYLKSIGFHKRSRAERNKVFVVGMNGILEELDIAGIPYIWCEDIAPSNKPTPSLDEVLSWKVDPAIGAVLVGATWGFNFAMNAYACLAYRSHPNNIFVCTNRDATFVVSGGIILPGTGSIVASIETGLQTTAINCGKPEKLLFELVNAATGGLDRNRTLMIGDRVDTDILFGQRSGIRTLLVFSGVTRKDEFKENDAVAKPVYYLDSVAGLLSGEIELKQKI